MKVAINRNINSKRTGPLLFSKRLFECLKSRGVKVVSPNDNPDIYFAIISFDHKKVPKRAKVILRVDGIYWNGYDKNMKMNKSIFNSICKADGVVYQSEFCQRCCEANGVRAKRSVVIINAINQKWVQKVSPVQLPHYPGLVACAKWRPTKRPVSICKSFLASDVSHHLYMIGDPPPNAIKNPTIHWLGNLSPSKSIGVMKSCSHAIHLAKFDPCPNAVVEEASVGLPVLHTSNGGTPEIVQNNGVCAPFDKGWQYNTLKEDIDNLNPNLVVPYIRDLINMDKTLARPDLDIESAASKYYNFFIRILK